MAKDERSSARIGGEAILQNCRSELRYYCRLRCYYTSVEGKKKELDGAETWLVGKTVNLSQRGIALVTQRPYPLEMIVAIAPLLPTWDPERQLLARISNVRQEAESGWRLGCEFVNPLTDTELKSFLGDID